MEVGIEAKISNKIRAVLKKNSSHCWGPEEQLNCLLQLIEFPMGRDFLISGGMSSYWIDYLVNKKKEPSLPRSRNPLQELIEQKSYLISSWREVYQIFIKLEQQQVRDGCVFASIPCGYMRDFFQVDFSKISEFKLIGIDLDRTVLKRVRKLSKDYGFHDRTATYCCDALDLPFEGQFDLVSSCGLNIYLTGFNQVDMMYKIFFKSLKEQGILLIHFLTVPPFLGSMSEWKTDKMDREVEAFDLFLLQKVIEFTDHSYIATNAIIQRLERIGFKEVKVERDSYGIGAVAIAKKN